MKTLHVAVKPTNKHTLLSAIEEATDHALQAAAQRACLHAENVQYVTKRAEWLDTGFLAEQMTVPAFQAAYVRFIEGQRLFIGDEKTWWVKK